jgi:hypothetical protein
MALQNNDPRFFLDCLLSRKKLLVMFSPANPRL